MNNPHGEVMDAENWPTGRVNDRVEGAHGRARPRRVSVTVDVPRGVDVVDVIVRVSEEPPANDDGAQR